MSDADVLDGADDTGQRPRTATRWFQRRGILLGAAIALIVAVAVVTDIPTAQSRASNISGADAFLKEVNADLDPCAYALTEAYGFRADQLRGTITPSERPLLPGLLADDQVACSYADPSIEDLTTGIESPGTAVSRQLGEALALSAQWVTYDALRAIEAIQGLASSPASTRDQDLLAKANAALAKDRASAQGYVTSADRQLGAALYQLKLPAVALPAAISAPAGPPRG